MITDDPYGVRNLRLAELGNGAGEKDPILTDIYLKIASREYGMCQHCALPDCAPKSKLCLLRNMKRKTNPQARLILESMYRRGEPVENIMAATGYTEKTALRYIQLYQHKMATDPCSTCKSRSICEAYHGTCHDKERWKGKRVSEGVQSA